MSLVLYCTRLNVMPVTIALVRVLNGHAIK